MADQDGTIHVIFAAFGEYADGGHHSFNNEHYSFNDIGELRRWLLNEHGDKHFESRPIRATIEAEHPDNGGGVTIYLGGASFL